MIEKILLMLTLISFLSFIAMFGGLAAGIANYLAMQSVNFLMAWSAFIALGSLAMIVIILIFSVLLAK